MRVLVTGGAGYIGSHAVKYLTESGYQVFVVDNLSTGHKEAIAANAEFIEGDTGNLNFISEILRSTEVEAVMHFAASIEVAESVVNPGKYYQNNFANSLVLLQAMHLVGVRKLVFSSTAAVYGNPEKVPIEEAQSRQPINPYGRSKMMTEMAIEDFSKSFGLGYAILRYFNVAGAAPDASIGEDHNPESHLIPRILKAALDDQGEAKIFGTDYPTPDGTCVRDYIHVMDLVRAHALALEDIEVGRGEIYNLGSENGFSVKEVLSACEKVTGKKIRVSEEGRRPGDPAILVASSEKIRSQLGWERKYPDLETIIEHAWKWHSQNPKGFESRRSPLTIDTEMA